MRTIKKNTNIKLQFFKNITIPNVLLAIISLSFISLAFTSNLTQNRVLELEKDKSRCEKKLQGEMSLQ